MLRLDNRSNGDQKLGDLIGSEDWVVVTVCCDGRRTGHATEQTQLEGGSPVAVAIACRDDSHCVTRSSARVVALSWSSRSFGAAICAACRGLE